MTRLTEKAQTHITIGGKDYELYTSYKNALLTVSAFYAHEAGELHHDPVMSSLITADIAISNMLKEEPPIEQRREAVNLISEYIGKYSRNSNKTDDGPPLLDIEQDAAYIFDAFQMMGIDLDVVDISYPRFMALLRVIPDKAPICRIVYLRQQKRSGKLTKEERLEITKVWGYDVINIRDRKTEKNQSDNDAYFKELQNKLRAERGLPPV